MSVRIRFVLILTLVVSIILLCSFFIIYSLSKSTREEEFNKRLWAQAYNEYVNFYKINATDTASSSNLAKYLPGAPINYRSVLLDDAYRVIFRSNKKVAFTVDTILLRKVKLLGESEFSHGAVQGVALFLNKDGHPSYSIATGFDKYGLERLSSLRQIMIFVGIGSVIFIGIFAFYAVIIATRPLVNLSVQMRRITENNLKQRVAFAKGNAKNNEIVQIANNFNNMLDRLDKAFQIQKNFVHHASHELRTPLATMLAQTELALRKNLSGLEAKKVLESLKEDQQEMIDLTNSLLLLSQYENVNYSPNWPVVRIDEIVYDTIDSAQKIIPGIAISFNFLNPPENELFLCLPANETLLRSAMLNLIKNAYKYSDNQQVAITMDAKENSILLNFDNNGQVITSDDSERMFLPFFRGENAHLKRGFGLGLSIVKRIVELHKGSVNYLVVNEDVNRFTLQFRRPFSG